MAHVYVCGLILTVCIRDIASGQELFAQYGPDYWTHHGAAGSGAPLLDGDGTGEEASRE